MTDGNDRARPLSAPRTGNSSLARATSLEREIADQVLGKYGREQEHILERIQAEALGTRTGQ